MSEMLILYLIYFPEMLVSRWKYYRLVLWLWEKIHPPQPEPVINKTTSVSKMEVMSQSTKPLTKMEEVMHSIDPDSLRKSPHTKQKILDVYADIFKGLRTFPGEP